MPMPSPSCCGRAAWSPSLAAVQLSGLRHRHGGHGLRGHRVDLRRPLRPAAGAAYLGSQGDIWDAQKDMLADTIAASPPPCCSSPGTACGRPTGGGLIPEFASKERRKWLPAARFRGNLHCNGQRSRRFPCGKRAFPPPSCVAAQQRHRLPRTRPAKDKACASASSWAPWAAPTATAASSTAWAAASRRCRRSASSARRAARRRHRLHFTRSASGTIRSATIRTAATCLRDGPFAVDEGLVKVSGKEALVRIHNTNTGKIIHARFASTTAWPPSTATSS